MKDREIELLLDISTSLAELVDLVERDKANPLARAPFTPATPSPVGTKHRVDLQRDARGRVSSCTVTKI